MYNYLPIELLIIVVTIISSVLEERSQNYFYFMFTAAILDKKALLKHFHISSIIPTNLELSNFKTNEKCQIPPPPSTLKRIELCRLSKCFFYNNVHTLACDLLTSKANLSYTPL